MKALAWAGSVFTGAVGAGWASRARQLLAPELAVQVLPDGFHFERSPSYHCQVTADLLEVAAADPELASVILPLASHMVAGAAATTHPDGRIAQFNDSGINMAYTAEALAAGLSALGGGRANAFECTVLAQAGLASLRTDRLSTFVKFGVPGPAALPAHAHGDIGSFELSAGRHRVVVDQGVFEYLAGSRRHASRSAVRHNITAPAHGAMADFFGAFRCGWMPTPRLHEAGCVAGSLVIDVTHDGFGSAGEHLELRRKLVSGNSFLEITDTLSGGAGAENRSSGWATRFLLHPDWHPVQGRGGWRLVGPAGLSLTVECDLAGREEAAEWWPDMGVAHETRRLVFAWEETRSSLHVVFRLN